MMRELLLDLADNPRVRRAVVDSQVAGELASRYVAGSSVEDLVVVLKELEPRGLRFAVTHFTEAPVNPDELERTVARYERIVRLIADTRLSESTEITLPFAALEVADAGPSLDAARRVCRAASNAGTSVTFGPDSVVTVDRDLELFGELRADFPTTGIELKGFWLRTEQDCRTLAATDAHVRLSGSAGRRGHDLDTDQRFRRGHESDLAYVRCMRVLMEGECYPMLATHDSRVTAIASWLARRNHRTPDEFEFQMPYGVRPWEQQRLVDVGHRVRLIVPFGEQWWPYFVHSLTEEPGKLWGYLRSYLGRR